MKPERYSKLTFELLGENDLFEMRGDKLFAKAPLDRETKKNYNIFVCLFVINFDIQTKHFYYITVCLLQLIFD